MSLSFLVFGLLTPLGLGFCLPHDTRLVSLGTLGNRMQENCQLSCPRTCSCWCHGAVRGVWARGSLPLQTRLSHSLPSPLLLFFTRAAVTKCHPRGGLKPRSEPSHCSGCWKPTPRRHVPGPAPPKSGGENLLSSARGQQLWFCVPPCSVLSTCLLPCVHISPF